jgi:hypothetical protein
VPFSYPAFADAQASYPTILKLLRREALDEPVKDVAHAVYVFTGVGLSVYPGAPETFGADAAYSATDAARDIEAVFGGGDRFAGPSEELLKGIPWNLILPILLQLLQEWLTKK